MKGLERLVYMANQIAREFESQQPGDPVAATWDHLWHFWDPGMRETILAHAQAGGEGLGETARAAVARLAEPVAPEPQTKATEFNPAGGGTPMSDAG